MKPLLLVLAGVALIASTAAAATWTLAEADAPVDNPLKGLVPYSAPAEGRFPHSMEFFYLPLSAVVKGEGKHDWSELERRLDDIAGRGRQAVFRVYLEYSGRRDVIPAHLVEAGLKVHPYKSGADEVIAPDYADPRLREMLAGFIAELGKRYDGDPRIGFITAGLLGNWGEWHTHPRPELFASKAVQVEVMDAYESAFSRTPVLLRYPAGEGHGRLAANALRPFGYHDDSFGWATLRTGKKEDGWFFLASMESAGAEAMARWKTHPIGGEIRPEAWGKIFDADPPAPIQDFDQCVRETQVSWLMDTGMFREKAPPERLRRALAAVRRMGYEFRVTRVEKSGRSLQVTILNQGIAPFYLPWKARFLALDAEGKPLGKEIASEHVLTGLLPGESAVWALELPEQAASAAKVLLGVPNPLPKGRPVRFANQSQDADRDGWLTLTPGPADAIGGK
jgi:hypothetical protein